MVNQLELTELLVKKDEFYDLMLSNLKQQLIAIEENNIEELQQVQRQWEKLSVAVDNIDKIILTKKDKVENNASITILQDLFKKSDTLKQLNQDLETQLRRRLTKAKEELEQIKLGQNVVKGYRVNSKNVSTFLDRNI